MRWTLLGLALTIAGTACAQDLSEEEAIKQLAKHGIKVYREKGEKEDRMYARARVANAEAMKALDLLRYVKRVDYLSLDITDAKLVKSSIDAVKYKPDVKGLNIDAKNGLAEADFDVIAKLGQLDGLFLRCNEVTAKQLQVLADLAKQKRLKSVNLRTAKFPQKELEQLRRALPERYLDFHQWPAIHFMDPLPIAKEESRAVKLQKQKLNAAIADIVAHLPDYNGFLGQDQALDVIRLHNLRNAALDLDDADLRRRIIDDYVFITEQRYKHVKATLDREPRRFDEGSLHRFEYEYAEAQLTQLRLTKQAEAKPK